MRNSLGRYKRGGSPRLISNATDKIGQGFENIKDVFTGNDSTTETDSTSSTGTSKTTGKTIVLSQGSAPMAAPSAAPSAAIKKTPQQKAVEAKPPSSGAISGGMEQKGVTIARRLEGDLDIGVAAAAGIVGNLMLDVGAYSPQRRERQRF